MINLITYYKYIVDDETRNRLQVNLITNLRLRLAKDSTVNVRDEFMNMRIDYEERLSAHT